MPEDAIAALKQVEKLLSSHPAFHVLPVKRASDPARRPSLLGQLIRTLRFRKFGVEFENGLTLLGFKLRLETDRDLRLDLQWHMKDPDAGRSVFLHFIDAAGEIRFQGDFSLAGEASDRLGFFYSRRRIEVPKEAPAGTYRMRLGVWYPEENRHATLIRFRGCQRETTPWCGNAVILDSIEIAG